MDRSSAYIGIDPGVTGAIALIHDEGQVVFDWPGDEVAASDLIMSLRVKYRIKGAALEDMGIGPALGKFGSSRLSENKGIWRGVLAAHGIPFRLVRPQTWKKGVVPKAKTDKEKKKAALAGARRLFPLADLAREKDHNRADALLIADWARRV
jgi:crossover junction endodeoxyribonuclease RuvC